MPETEEPTHPLAARPWFTTTQWSVVVNCGSDDAASSVAALEKLCCTYWYPLYAYVRRLGHPVEEAKDLTQEFFARLIQKHWVAEADRNKGRFRTFLLTALNHFLANEWRRAQAAKRGGGRAVVSLDATAEARYLQEAAPEVTPERVYERRWALNLFDQALRRLRHEYEVAGKARHFDSLKRFLSVQASDGEYDRIASELDMSTGAVAAAVHRLRQHYRTLVRAEVAQTVESREDLEDEMRWLLDAVS